MRATSTISWVLVIIVEFVLLLLTFVESARSWLLGSGPQGFYILLNTNIAVIILWVGLRSDQFERRVGDEVSDLNAQLERLATSTSSVTALVDEDFYARFRSEIAKAQVGVAMTHLDTHPPSPARATEAKDYYANLHEVIKSTPRVRFRRVERASPHKKGWLEELTRDFKGVSNFSLGVLLVTSNDRRVGTVSVQLIDETHAVLVAVAEHDSSLGPRDVWITDRGAVALWKRYYDDNLWQASIKVIENGNLNESEWQKVTDFIDRQCPST